MNDSTANEINLGAGAQASQAAAGSNISQTYIAQQIVNQPAPPREFVAPFQAPADLETFVGRADTLQLLAGLGARGTMPPRFMLVGIGGLGKTTLATKIAHQLRNVFDGGVLWADIPSVELALKLNEWAELYQGDVSKIEDLNQRADRVRAIIHERVGNKRALAVLDGVIDENDEPKLEPLLRALRDCAVLVTTRATNLAALYHFREIPIGAFGEQDAVDLFHRILLNDARLGVDSDLIEGTDVSGFRKPERSQIHALGAAVGWLPFALELLAKQLVKHREWMLANLQTKLAQSKLELLKWSSVNDKEKNIYASFLLSYNGLNETEKMFFQTLGAFGGIDFDFQASAFVAQVDDARAEEMLEHLLELSMAQTGNAMGRYRLHALMRDFARELCSENLYDAELRMATHYYIIFKTTANDINITHSEISNFRSSIDWAREKPNDAMWKLLRGFAYEAVGYVGIQGYWDEIRKWLEFGVEASEDLKDDYGTIELLISLVAMNVWQGQWDMAISVAKKLLETTERLGDWHGIALAYTHLGHAYSEKGEWDTAIYFLQKAMQTMEYVSDVHLMANIYYSLGSIHADKGEWDTAIDFYHKALAVSERVDDVYGIQRTFNGLGSIHADKGEWDTAIEFYKKSLEIKESLRLPPLQICFAARNLGELYEKQGKLNEAIQMWEKAITILEFYGSFQEEEDRAHLEELKKKLSPAD